MKVEELKLYNIYKDIDETNDIDEKNIEYIYIGITNDNYYWFLYKNENSIISYSLLDHYGFDPNKIIKNLNLETGFYVDGCKYITGYDLDFFTKQSVEKYLIPNLKDKLKNIINR
jgi:hypothetical protein